MKKILKSLPRSDLLPNAACTLQKTTELIKALGVPPAHIEEVVGPLDEDKTLDSLVKKTVKKFGRIDVLVSINILYFPNHLFVIR